MKLEILYRILAFFWQRIIPLLIMSAFLVGVFFNLWDVQNIPLIWSLAVTIIGGGLLIFVFGKIIKMW